jgi:Leucine-rich repeat (LRR) protein
MLTSDGDAADGLTVLNLANNEIQIVQNLDPLSTLTKLNLSNNKLTVSPCCDKNKAP